MADHYATHHYPTCHQQDVPRHQCYVCHVQHGKRYVYNPDATCPACGSHIPTSGHTCPGLTTTKENR